MSGFKDASLNRLIAVKSLDFIVDKVLQCLEMMREDCAVYSKKIANNEIVIRDYLYCNYLDNDTVRQSIGLDTFIFIPEAPENYIDNKPVGRADLKIIGFETFRHSKRYFIIECKRIDGELTLNRKYINEGIRRFVGDSPKYHSNYGISCILGFVVKNIDISKNVDNINGLLRTDYSDIHVHEYLHAGTVQNTYISSHGLSDVNRVRLNHAFSDCSSMVG